MKKQERRFKMNKEKLLEFKNKKKAKNPKFLRQDSYKKKRLSKVWRKSRGWDSKQRKRMQRQAIVEPGYGSPKSLRGVHKSGLLIVKVVSLSDVKKINPKTQGAVVSGKIGLKRKLTIIEELLKHKITIFNIKNAEAYLKSKKEDISKKKEKKEERSKEEEKKETQKKEEKESIEEKVSDEEKKKLEKQEIDKLLTKKF